MTGASAGSQYRWVRVSAVRAPSVVRGELFAAHATSIHEIARHEVDNRLSRFSFKSSLEEVGVPVLDGSPEEELAQLLREAAEIEHGLMLQYLYAFYSIKYPKIAGIVRLIAIEEMGHFITVQNLLAACRQAPHMQLVKWGQKAEFQPFTFTLEPASTGSLAKYCVAEMPDPELVPGDIMPDLQVIVAEGDAAAGSKVENQRVGLLYAKIYWLLRKDDEPLPAHAVEPWPNFPVASMAANPELAGRHVTDDFVSDARGSNATREEWAGNFASVIVEPISGRDAALSAIAKIAAQGEGFADEAADGHFERFVSAWRLAKAQADLALPLPVNPIIAPASGPGKVITSVVGRQFAHLGDRLYELTLLCTAVNLLLPAQTDPNLRAKVAHAAIAVMRSCLHGVASALSTIPLADQDGGLVCGLPFTVPIVGPPPDLRAARDRALAVIAEIRGLIDDIAQGDATLTQQAAADEVGSTINDIVAKAIEALPVQ